MFTRSRLFFSMIVLLASSTNSLAQDQASLSDVSKSQAKKTEPQENAALKYWQAYGFLLTSLTEEERAILDAGDYQGALKQAGGNAAESEKRVLAVIEKTEMAMKLLHRGAEIGHCDWSLDYDKDGPYTSLAHFQATRSLTRVAMVRACYYFEHDRADEAVDDLMATIIMARHVGEEGRSIDMLIQIAIEGIVQHRLARYLPTIPEDSLRQLPKRIKNLPPPGDLKTAIERECSSFSAWCLKQAKDAQSKEDLVVVLQKVGVMKNDASYDSPNKYRAEASEESHFDKILAKTEGRPENFRKLVASLGEYQKELVELYPLSPTLFSGTFRSFEERIGRENPLAAYWFKNHGAIIYANVRYQVKWKIIRAGIAIQLEGPKAIKKFKDPYGEGSFLYLAHPKGFKLRSEIPYQPFLSIYHVELAFGYDKNKY